jgi:hypothetical protein
MIISLTYQTLRAAERSSTNEADEEYYAEDDRDDGDDRLEDGRHGDIGLYRPDYKTDHRYPKNQPEKSYEHIFRELDLRPLKHL